MLWWRIEVVWPIVCLCATAYACWMFTFRQKRLDAAFITAMVGLLLAFVPWLALTPPIFLGLVAAWMILPAGAAAYATWLALSHRRALALMIAVATSVIVVIPPFLSLGRFYAAVAGILIGLALSWRHKRKQWSIIAAQQERE